MAPSSAATSQSPTLGGSSSRFLRRVSTPDKKLAGPVNPHTSWFLLPQSTTRRVALPLVPAAKAGSFRHSPTGDAATPPACAPPPLPLSASLLSRPCPPPAIPNASDRYPVPS